jgi:hypothetical protein
MLRNIPEKRTPHRFQGESLKLRTKLLFPKADSTYIGIWSAPVPIRTAPTADKGMFKHCDRVPRCGRKIHYQFVQIAAQSEAEFLNFSVTPCLQVSCRLPQSARCGHVGACSCHET